MAIKAVKPMWELKMLNKDMQNRSLSKWRGEGG
jgi:hypothetical protein